MCISSLLLSFELQIYISSWLLKLPLREATGFKTQYIKILYYYSFTTSSDFFILVKGIITLLQNLHCLIFKVLVNYQSLAVNKPLSFGSKLYLLILVICLSITYLRAQLHIIYCLLPSMLL